jgi:putative protease
MILRSQLKVLKRALVPQLDAALKAWFDEPCAVVASTVVAKNPSTSSLAIKIDNLDYLPWIASYCEANPTFSLSELTFECKRHSLHLGAGQTALQNLQSWTRANGVKFRLSLPTVMRAWDTTYVSQMIKWFVALDESSFEIGNLGSLELLRRVTGREQKDLDVSSDFTLYALNSLASKKIADLGIQKITLSVEDDVNNIKNHLQNWQAQAVPEMILFKDTPLFIAESCSLTALHNGCPGPKVCGYRTLVIEDEQKQIYHVAHESCRTIVYGDKPFAVSHFRSDLEEIGFRNFRMDFLTKPYTKEEIHAVIEAVEKGLVIPNSHLGNFSTSLL